MMRRDENDGLRRDSQPNHGHFPTYVDLKGVSEDRRPQLNEGNMPSSVIAASSSDPRAASDAAAAQPPPDWVMIDASDTVGHDGQETLSTRSGHGPSEPRDETGRRRRAPLGEGAVRGSPGLSAPGDSHKGWTLAELALLDIVNKQHNTAGCPINISSWAEGASPAYVGPARHEGPHHAASSLRVRGGARTHASDVSSAFAPVHSPDTGGLDVAAICDVGAWQEEQALPPHVYYHNAALELDPY